MAGFFDTGPFRTNDAIRRTYYISRLILRGLYFFLFVPDFNKPPVPLTEQKGPLVPTFGAGRMSFSLQLHVEEFCPEMAREDFFGFADDPGPSGITRYIFLG